jgi:hypothetical protein
MADLADAVDALRAEQYLVAVVLAEAAIEGKSKVRTAIRPLGMAQSLPEIRAAIEDITSAR